MRLPRMDDKTGDVGMLDEKGRLVIIDRVKCIFKLAQGEYVAPEKVENLLTILCNSISNIFVTGDSHHNYAVAIVVSKNESTMEQILTEMKSVGKENGLKGFEIPQRISLVDDFPDEILTPTFKVKRNVARRHYADTIHKLYS